MSNKPTALVINGDLTNFGHSHQLDEFKKGWLSEFPVHVLLGLGNHDIQNNINDCALNFCAHSMIAWFLDHLDNQFIKADVSRNSSGLFVRYTGTLAYSVELCQQKDLCAHLIQLNNALDYGVKFSALFVEWDLHSPLFYLKMKLKEAETDNNPVLINLHQCQWIDEEVMLEVIGNWIYQNKLMNRTKHVIVLRAHVHSYHKVDFFCLHNIEVPFVYIGSVPNNRFSMLRISGTPGFKSYLMGFKATDRVMHKGHVVEFLDGLPIWDSCNVKNPSYSFEFTDVATLQRHLSRRSWHSDKIAMKSETQADTSQVVFTEGCFQDQQRHVSLDNSFFFRPDTTTGAKEPNILLKLPGCDYVQASQAPPNTSARQKNRLKCSAMVLKKQSGEHQLPVQPQHRFFIYPIAAGPACWSGTRSAYLTERTAEKGSMNANLGGRQKATVLTLRNFKQTSISVFRLRKFKISLPLALRAFNVTNNPTIRAQKFKPALELGGENRQLPQVVLRTAIDKSGLSFFAVLALCGRGNVDKQASKPGGKRPNTSGAVKTGTVVTVGSGNSIEEKNAKYRRVRANVSEDKTLLDAIADQQSLICWHLQHS
ncbi:unnamed protein product [Caenorhabditis auriculariae]|uniref:Calcineurin-like phosphoesterase domain-containing protein n=1 Tax=Caenorhabditis auriculariae TaxID=2777116 RepID=A0A8S1GSH2_9PELO|nr:unnamed protein product [Caenorhabditis auriculariae]